MLCHTVLLTVLLVLLCQVRIPSVRAEPVEGYDVLRQTQHERGEIASYCET